MLTRRGLLLAAVASPLVSACSPRPPQTPLAHLYGPRWVSGAYELYAGGYQGVQLAAEERCFEPYRYLAQRGVTSLAALQSRDVPFYVRVDAREQGFSLERAVPERLTIRASMTPEQRREASERWHHAREHLHQDYEEIRLLNASLTTLFQQLRAIRNAIEVAKIEQYSLVRQLDAMAQGGTPPFALPYQVTPVDYEQVLLLLIERLDDDVARLGAIEASIVTVGLVARATDANSGSLSANLNRVLLAVVSDAEASKPRAAAFPTDSGERASLAAKGAALRDEIRASEAYRAWLTQMNDAAFEPIGVVMTLLDRMTGLPASAIYRQVVDIWRGDADYLSYLKSLVSFVPGGGAVAKCIEQGIALTERARDVQQVLRDGLSADDVIALASKKGLGVLNTQSKYALDRLDKQLSLFANQSELVEVGNALSSSPLLQGIGAL